MGDLKTRICLTGRPHPAVSHYHEMSLYRDDNPEGMSDGLQSDVVRIILKDISNMRVSASHVSPLSTMYSYERLCRFLVSLNINAILGLVTFH